MITVPKKDCIRFFWVGVWVKVNMHSVSSSENKIIGWTFESSHACQLAGKGTAVSTSLLRAM